MVNDNTGQPGENSGRPSNKPGEIGATEAFWAFFSSMKTAIVLLLVLAAASIAGTVIPQNEPPEFYINKFGAQKYALMQRLALTDVYHSTWFSVLLLLVGINLAVCSLNRFGMAWRRTFKPEVGSTPQTIKAMGRWEKLACRCGPQDAASKAGHTLKSRGYRVSRADSGGSISLHAVKGRIGIWGPYLVHLSILVVFAGAIYGSSFGFHGFTAITEGEDTSTCVLEQGHQTKDLGFAVRLHNFTIQYKTRRSAEGRLTRAVTGYKSDLEIIDGGKSVLRREIDVNNPLSYKGVSFFQSSYGLDSLILTVTGPDGETVRESFRISTQNRPGMPAYGVPMSDDNPREIHIGGRTIGVFVHNLAPDYVGGDQINASNLPVNVAAQVMINDDLPNKRGMQGWSRPAWVARGGRVTHNGFTVGLQDCLAYTGLQVSRNPGLPVIYTGFGLMLLGIAAAFYVNHRTVRVFVSESAEGSEVFFGASSRADMSVFDGDLARLREELSGQAAHRPEVTAGGVL